MILFERVKKVNLFTLIYIILSFVLVFPELFYAQTSTGSLNFKGLTRDYIVFLPQNYEPNMPVIFTLHGATEDGEYFMGYTLMNEVADTAGFIVVYPTSIYPRWNTGLSDKPEPDVDDVGFFSALIDTLKATYDIDLNRVYSCGYSNGGMMTYKLACQLGYRIAAGAGVGGPITDSTANNSHRVLPFPVLICHGTADEPLYSGTRSGIMSVEQTLDFWLQKNECVLQADTLALPDIDPSDNCTVEKISYLDCSEESKVLYYKVINGGHHWPGEGEKWNGGNMNRDINIGEEIWDFVKNYELTPMAYTKNVSVNQVYLRPGTDTLGIKAQIENPNEYTLSVLALIRSRDGSITDSCYFADDGNHNDDNSGDGIWGGFWPVHPAEKLYKLNIKTISLDMDQYTLSYDNIVPDFVTIGPLVYKGWTPYIIEDSTANPGDILSFKLYLRNDGQERRVDDVEARLYADDPRITIHNFHSTFGNISAGATVESGQGYSIQISSEFTQDTTIYFTLKISSDGNHYWNDTMPLHIVTSISNNDQPFPKTYALDQNYPNPFNPTTIINYELPTTIFIDLSIYNLLGEKITTLVSEKQNAGYHQVEWDAGHLSSGVYYYILRAGDFQDVKKMILLR
jgi:polyhydroxybutyrate depolymerase